MREGLSIVVAAYNEESYLRDCLDSVVKYVASGALEIIVVNNASTDSTRELAMSYPGVTVVDEKWKGNAYARQRGVEASSGSLIAFLDADTRIPGDWWVARAMAAFDDPLIMSYSGPYRYYDFPAWLNVLVEIYSRTVVTLTYKISGYKVVAGNFVVRRKALEAIGGFDKSIAFYGDDTDIARRLSLQGTTKYERSFWVWASARRFKKEGIVRLVWRYLMNSWSEILFHKPYSQMYIDVR